MRVTQEIMEKVREEYLADPNKDWREIAGNHNINRDQVKKILITCGLYSDSRTEEIKKFIDKGWTTQDIAEQLFLSREMISLLTPYDFSERKAYVTHAAKQREEVLGKKQYEKKTNSVLDCLLLKIITDRNVSYSIVPGNMPLRVLQKWIGFVNDIKQTLSDGYFEFEAAAAEELTSKTVNLWRKLIGIVFYSPHFEIKDTIREREFAGPYDDVTEDDPTEGMQNDLLIKRTYFSPNKAEVSFDGLQTDQVQLLYKKNIFRVMETLSVEDVIGNTITANEKINSRVLRAGKVDAKGILQGLTNTILFHYGGKTAKVINLTLSNDSDVMNLPKPIINTAVRRCQTEWIPVKLDVDMGAYYAKK